jgi:hypothetical protein
MHPRQSIKFFTQKHLIGAIPSPVQANKMLPEYFKKIKPQTDNHPSSGTVKRCIPFLDAASMGYIIPLWADVFVQARDGDLQIDFPKNLPMESSMSPHGQSQIEDHPLANKPYGNIPLKWHNPWGIQTPEGWSVLITQPLNHLETRFKILDGVVDTDEYYNQVNFPFLWTGGNGEFLLPQGMPLVQVIPFKRETLDCEICEEDADKKRHVLSKLGTVMSNAYRKKFWHKLRETEGDEE